MADSKRKNRDTTRNRPGGEATLSPRDWVEAALKVFVQGGIDQVKVEALAQRLGVTKGSFYWHFADRNALLAAMVAHWREESTQRYINLARSLRGSPISRIHRIFDAMGQANSMIVQNAFRQWGYSDPKIAALVRESDQRRRRLLQGLLEELGFSAAEAQFRAEIVGFWAIGEVASGDCLDDAQARVGKAKELLRLLTASVRKRKKAARRRVQPVLDGARVVAKDGAIE